MVRSPKRNRGLTLVELLIVVSVAAILVSFAIPDLSDFVRNNRLTTQINELQTSVTLARNEAIRRNVSVSVCPRGEEGSCGEDWSNGWLVFLGDSADDAAGGDEILRVADALPGGAALSYSSELVVYGSTGLASAGANATFTLCDDRGDDYAKGLAIGATGRPRVINTGLSCS